MTARNTKAEPEDLVPLRPLVFDILLMLSEEERHGYRIMKEARERSSGRLLLGPGTLYRTLQEMQDSSLIEPSDERPDPERDDGRRRYYRLTPFGREVAAAEAKRMADLVRTARATKLLGSHEEGP